MQISITKEQGITLEDLKQFVDDCYEKFPHNIPVTINQNDTTDCCDMKADEESITFYDWI